MNLRGISFSPFNKMFSEYKPYTDFVVTKPVENLQPEEFITPEKAKVGDYTEYFTYYNK